MSERTVTLAGKDYPVQALPFGHLKKALPVMMRIGVTLAAGSLSEADMDTLGNVVAWGVGLDTLDDLRVRADELMAAFQVVAEVSGLAQKETVPGESQGPGSTGTSSTPNSPPSPDGTGTSLIG